MAKMTPRIATSPPPSKSVEVLSELPDSSRVAPSPEGVGVATLLSPAPCSSNLFSLLFSCICSKFFPLLLVDEVPSLLSFAF